MVTVPNVVVAHVPGKNALGKSTRNVLAAANNKGYYYYYYYYYGGP